VTFEKFILDFEGRTVVVSKKKILLLVIGNFSRHEVPNIGFRLHITRLES
jgi:hypothetical protein